MDQWIRRFKSADTIEGQDEVIVPGEPETRAQAERSVNGIPLVDKVVHDLKTIAEELKIPFDIAK